MATAGRRTELGDMLVTARPLDEYLAMFALGRDDVAGRRILDCPGGAASFTAEASELGAEATAVDPIYDRDVEDLVEWLREETRRGNAHARRNLDHYAWDFYRGPEDHLQRRLAAIDRFRDDVRDAPGRYVPAALPALPYRDDSFDLALSSHLLFIYDDRLDLRFHRAAADELLRVAPEVRLFPVVALDGDRSVMLDPLVDHLERRGVDVAIEAVPFEFQRGANEVLVARRRVSGG